jgi:hypothetical protein
MSPIEAAFRLLLFVGALALRLFLAAAIVVIASIFGTFLAIKVIGPNIEKMLGTPWVDKYLAMCEKYFDRLDRMCRRIHGGIARYLKEAME